MGNNIVNSLRFWAVGWISGFLEVQCYYTLLFTFFWWDSKFFLVESLHKMQFIIFSFFFFFFIWYKAWRCSSAVQIRQSNLHIHFEAFTWSNLSGCRLFKIFWILICLSLPLWHLDYHIHVWLKPFTLPFLEVLLQDFIHSRVLVISDLSFPETNFFSILFFLLQFLPIMVLSFLYVLSIMKNVISFFWLFKNLQLEDMKMLGADIRAGLGISGRAEDD